MRRGGLPAAINVKVRTSHVVFLKHQFASTHSFTVLTQFDETLDTFGMKILKTRVCQLNEKPEPVAYGNQYSLQLYFFV